MKSHSIKLGLDSDGVHAHFNCHEPADGWCRQTCSLGCEVWTTECMADHPREMIKYCNPIEFVDNMGLWYEQYIGTETEPRSGAVVFEWQSDEWYGWRYADEAGAPE